MPKKPAAPPPPRPEYLSTSKVAARLGVAEGTIRKRCAKLDCRKDVDRYMIDQATEDIIAAALNAAGKHGPKPGGRRGAAMSAA